MNETKKKVNGGQSRNIGKLSEPETEDEVVSAREGGREGEEEAREEKLRNMESRKEMGRWERER